eukprot:150248_1
MIYKSAVAVWLPNTIVDAIKDVILQFDVELLHFKIKNNKNIQEFSESIMQMVDEIIDEENKHSDDDDADMINTIYETVAQCFIHKHNESIPAACNDWICSSCGNHNFCKYIN